MRVWFMYRIRGLTAIYPPSYHQHARLCTLHAVLTNISLSPCPCCHTSCCLHARAATRLDAPMRTLPHRTLRRRLKKTAALWIRIQATVPVTRKPEGIRMGKGKGHIEFYACAVRPGQIIFEMDRVPRKVALTALEAIQPKFPCKLGFVEWN